MTIYTVSLISIENKYLYDGIRDLKKERKKVWQKAGLRYTQSRDLSSTPLQSVCYIDSAVLCVIPPVHLD